MKNQFLEGGKIVNTHGIRGEVKIDSWCDSPEFLCGIATLYLDDGTPVKVNTARVHKNSVIAALDGVDDINAAMCLKGKTVLINRADAPLPAGRHFLADLIGIEVRDAASGAVLGTLTETLTPPAHPVYIVKGAREYLIPAVEEFIVETNLDGGYMRVRLIEGMGE